MMDRGRPKRRPRAGRARQGPFRLALGFALALASAASATPDWWTGPPEAALDSALNRKAAGIVLCLERQGSEECARLDAETFPNIADELSEQFVWVRMDCGAAETRKFLEFYSVESSPQIVVVDLPGYERIRVHGFASAAVLSQALQALANSRTASAGGLDSRSTKEPTIFIAGGEVRGALKDLERIREHRKKNESEGHLIYESFDPDELSIAIDDLTTASHSIEWGGEAPGTRALRVGQPKRSDATPNPSTAAVRIDLSERLSGVQASRGLLAVSFLAKRSFPPRGKARLLGCIIVRPAQAPPPGLMDTEEVPDSNVAPIFGFSSVDVWIERYVPSLAFDFKTSKAYLLLWARNPEDAFLLDDLTVDILSDQPRLASRIIPDPVRLCLPPPVIQCDDCGWGYSLASDEPIRRQDIPAELLSFFDSIDLNHDGKVQTGVPEK